MSWRYAGKLVSRQRLFEPTRPSTARAEYSRSAQGGVLYVTVREVVRRTLLNEGIYLAVTLINLMRLPVWCDALVHSPNLKK